MRQNALALVLIYPSNTRCSCAGIAECRRVLRLGLSYVQGRTAALWFRRHTVSPANNMSSEGIPLAAYGRGAEMARKLQAHMAQAGIDRVFPLP